MEDQCLRTPPSSTVDLSVVDALLLAIIDNKTSLRKKERPRRRALVMPPRGDSDLIASDQIRRLIAHDIACSAPASSLDARISVSIASSALECVATVDAPKRINVIVDVSLPRGTIFPGLILRRRLAHRRMRTRVESPRVIVLLTSLDESLVADAAKRPYSFRHLMREGTSWCQAVAASIIAIGVDVILCAHDVVIPRDVVLLLLDSGITVVRHLDERDIAHSVQFLGIPGVTRRLMCEIVSGNLGGVVRASVAELFLADVNCGLVKLLDNRNSFKTIALSSEDAAYTLRYCVYACHRGALEISFLDDTFTTFSCLKFVVPPAATGLSRTYSHDDLSRPLGSAVSIPASSSPGMAPLCRFRDI